MKIISTFYLNQSGKNIKRSLLTIISLGLAISLITGVSIYLNTINYYNLDKRFDNLHDFSIIDIHKSTQKSLNFSDRFNNEENIYLNTIQESKIDIESIDHYASIYSSDLLLFKNYTNEEHSLRLSRFEISQIKFELFNRDFFSSQRFQDYFKIIEGDIPQNENEIIIDAILATRLDLHIQTYSSLPIYINSSSIQEISQYSLDNFTIVGIYAPLRYSFYIGSINYLFDDPSDYYKSAYTYNDNFNSIDLLQYPITLMPIFGILSSNQDFSALEHPLNSFFNTLNDNSKINYSISYYVEYGIGINYDRKSINTNFISREIKQIGSQFNELKNNLPSGILYGNNLVYDLSYSLKQDIEDRVNVALTTIPVIIFCVFLSSIAININFKSRFDEFLYMRTKGVPKKIIRNQLLFEVIFIGISSSIVSIIIGLGVFYILQPWLNPIFLQMDSVYIYQENLGVYASFSNENLLGSIRNSPSFSLGIFFSNILYCLLLTIAASGFSLYKLKHLKIHKMREELDKNSLDALYSETLYESDDTELSAQDSKKELYETQIEKTEKKIPKWGLKLIIPAFVPLIITLVYMIGKIPNISDFFIDLSTKIESFVSVIAFFAFFMPILLVIGIIQYIVAESPSRFARLSKKISSVIMKDYSHLIGLEIIRRKSYYQMIFLLSIFTSLLVFANVNINSLNRKDLIKDNFEIGADIQMTSDTPYNISDTYDFFTPMILNKSELENFETNLSNIQDDDGNYIINNAVSLIINNYISDSYMWVQTGARGSDDDRGMMVYLDLENYLEVIGENNKNLPSDKFKSQVQEVIEYNKNNDDSIPGVIVNREFLFNHNGPQIGDIIEIAQQIYNVSSEYNTTVSIQVKILQEINVLPGISPDFSTNSNYPNDIYGEVILIDRSFINETYQQLQIGKLKELIDIKQPDSYNTTDIQLKINNIFPTNLNFPKYRFYNDKWNSLSLTSFTLQSASGYDTFKYYNMLYLNLIVIGFLCALTLAIINLEFQKDNDQFHGLMLVRGLGKKKLIQFILAQLFVIFSISLIVGLLGGFITSWAWMKCLSISGGFNYSSFRFDLPILFNLPELVIVLGILVGFSFFLYFTSTFLRIRKPINQYFYKF